MVQGLAEFERRWSAIPGKVRAAVADEMEKIANAVVSDMKRAAPVDSGDLQMSIRWTWGDAPKGSMVIGTVGGREYSGLRITIYAGGGDAFYARFVEFGTQAHSLTKNASVQRAGDGSGINRRRQSSGPQHPGAAARPFFYPVWRFWRRRIKSRITRAITKALKEA